LIGQDLRAFYLKFSKFSPLIRNAIGRHFMNSNISRVAAVKLLKICIAAAVRQMDTAKSQRSADGSEWTFLSHPAINLPVPTGYKFW
jgi:hypothetical protein